MAENEDKRREQRPAREVKLTPFWPTNPASRFRAAEGKFFLRGIDDELARFYNCLHALPKSTITLISDLVEADPPPANPYTALKARLLTKVQRVEMLFNLPPLGAQKPSGWRR